MSQNLNINKQISIRAVQRSQGFLVLTMVLIISAVVLAITTGMMLRSIGDVSETGDSEMSLKAKTNVNACGEYALLQMIASTTSTTTTAANWAYGGDETVLIPLPDGPETCYIYSVETSGTSKLIKASSTVSGFTKKILIEVATNTPSIDITSWEEVADF